MVEKNMNALMRHYVHGDLVEGTIDSYYCTACDAFETEKHFLDEKHIKNRSKQYFASLNRWINWDAISKQRLRRAPDAVNLLQLLAIEDARKYESSKSKFYKWVGKQVDRDDIIGDLSKNILRDKKFPVTSSNLVEIRNYIGFKNGCPEAFVALDEAWIEFSPKIKSRISISLKVRFAILKRDLYCCRICGNSASNEIRLEVDHKIPVAKGGTNSEENLWILCFDCNRGKATQDL